jgi:hypothetical protein
MNIDCRDITFVVQGNIQPGAGGDYLPQNFARQSLRSIRKHFPESPLILSTWAGQDASRLPADQIVYNQDPGSFPYFFGTDTTPNNVNRQIVSTLNGLKLVRTKYACKIRTDFCLTGKTFTREFGKYNKYAPKYKVAAQRILACTYVTRNPASELPYPFHISDFAFFGLTTDLRDLFDIPLMSAAEAVWFKKHKYPPNEPNPARACRYTPEQHIMLRWLQKHKQPVNCASYYDASPQNIQDTRGYLANNFVLLSPAQFNIRPQKDKLLPVSNINSFKTCYTHLDWLKMYKEYCDSSLTLPAKDRDAERTDKLASFNDLIELLLNGAMFLTVPGRQRRRDLRPRLFRLVKPLFIK